MVSGRPGTRDERCSITELREQSQRRRAETEKTSTNREEALLVRVKTVDVALDLGARSPELVAELAGEGATLHLDDGARSHVLK